jgi:GDP-L-fucose synthase
MLHNGAPHPSNYGYAYAKRILDIRSRAYSEEYGCNFTTVIPTNVYGPHDNFGEGCHFVPAMVRRFVDATGEFLRTTPFYRD